MSGLSALLFLIGEIEFLELVTRERAGLPCRMPRGCTDPYLSRGGILYGRPAGLGLLFYFKSASLALEFLSPVV